MERSARLTRCRKLRRQWAQKFQCCSIAESATGQMRLKALALGARAVLLGRLYIYGLAVAGEQGVREAVINFLADMDVTMGLCGIKACREIGPELLAKVI